MNLLQNKIKKKITANVSLSFWPQQGGFILSDNGIILKISSIQAPIGHLVYMKDNQEMPFAEVVGYDQGLTMAARLNHQIPVFPGSSVIYLPHRKILSAVANLNGRVVDALGDLWLDSLQDQSINIEKKHDYNDKKLFKKGINQTLDTGVRAIDGLLTLGRGQRIGLMAGSGVGKSSLIGMISRQAKADVIIVALIGERGREITEFLQKKLPAESRDRALIIAAPADQTPAMKIKAATLAHNSAMFHANKGKHVLLIMDSLTRISHAQREIAISIGEPAITRGYPASTFSLMSKLIETGGNFTNGGSITGIYSVLVDSDDPDDPILDNARALLDGHIILSRKLAENGHYPAIDIAKSLSRVMDDICSEDHLNDAQQFRRMWNKINEIKELRSLGLYDNGLDNDTEIALGNELKLQSYLIQNEYEEANTQNTLLDLKHLMRSTQ